MSIQSGRSTSRTDVIYETFSIMYRMENKGVPTCFLWVPAHVSVEGNEQVDILAKQTLRIKQVDLQVPLSKAEAKTLIRTYAQSVWQEYWDDNVTGRHLYNIKRQVGAGRMVGW